MAPSQVARKHGFVAKVAGGCSSYDVIAPWPDLTGSIFFAKNCARFAPLGSPKPGGGGGGCTNHQHQRARVKQTFYGSWNITYLIDDPGGFICPKNKRPIQVIIIIIIQLDTEHYHVNPACLFLLCSILLSDGRFSYSWTVIWFTVSVTRKSPN